MAVLLVAVNIGQQNGMCLITHTHTFPTAMADGCAAAAAVPPVPSAVLNVPADDAAAAATDATAAFGCWLEPRRELAKQTARCIATEEERKKEAVNTTVPMALERESNEKNCLNARCGTQNCTVAAAFSGKMCVFEIQQNQAK